MGACTSMSSEAGIDELMAELDATTVQTMIVKPLRPEAHVLAERDMTQSKRVSSQMNTGPALHNPRPRSECFVPVLSPIRETSRRSSPTQLQPPAVRAVSDPGSAAAPPADPDMLAAVADSSLCAPRSLSCCAVLTTSHDSGDVLTTSHDSGASLSKSNNDCASCAPQPDECPAAEHAPCAPVPAGWSEAAAVLKADPALLALFPFGPFGDRRCTQAPNVRALHKLWKQMGVTSRVCNHPPGRPYYIYSVVERGTYFTMLEGIPFTTTRRTKLGKVVAGIKHAVSTCKAALRGAKPGVLS